jgi:hypothetical protein
MTPTPKQPGANLTVAFQIPVFHLLNGGAFVYALIDPRSAGGVSNRSASPSLRPTASCWSASARTPD